MSARNINGTRIGGKYPVTIEEDNTAAAGNSSSSLDAFERLRVATPYTIFDSKQLQDKQPLYWDDANTSGSGTSSTYNVGESSTTLAVTSFTSGTRVRQTFRRFQYQPGKSQLFMFTGILGNPVNGIHRRIGCFDENDGLFFESMGAQVSVVERSSTSGGPVDTKVGQHAWNLDKMDGLGPSGVTLDFTKVQIFFIDFQWLGGGVVRYGVSVNGRLFYVHQTGHSNLLTKVYMATPNLPLRYEIGNDGNGAVAASLVHICAAVMSEGGFEFRGGTRSLVRGTSVLQTLNNTAIYPIIALRLKSTHKGALVVPTSLNVLATTNSAYNWYLLLNPTVVGTAFSFTGLTNSAVEYDVSRTNATTLTDGTIVAAGSDQQSNESSTVVLSPSDLQLGSSIAGVSDILVLAVQRISGTTESYLGAIQWREQL